MAQDDSVAHFFGGRTENPGRPAPQAGDDLDLGADGAEETVVEGEIAVDVYETANEVVVVSPIAGVDPENIEISAGEDEITISGQRRGEHVNRSENLITQEIYWGSFSRTIRLPAVSDASRANASFKHGVLTVTIPKAAVAKKKTIKVRSEE